MKDFFRYAKNRFLYSLIKIIFILLLGSIGFKSIYNAYALESCSYNLLEPGILPNYNSSTGTYTYSTNSSYYTETSRFNLSTLNLSINHSYIFSFEKVSSTNNDMAITVLFWDSSGSYIKEINSSYDLLSFTVPSNAKSISFRFARKSILHSDTLVIKNVMITDSANNGGYVPFISCNQESSNINNLTFSTNLNYTEGTNYNELSNVNITGIGLGSSKSYNIGRCSNNYFYKDIYANFTGTFEKGKTYSINYTFSATYMPNIYTNHISTYIKTNNDTSYVKDVKIDFVNYGSSYDTYYYKVNTTFTATENFTTVSIGATFDTASIYSSNVSANIGRDGTSGACPYIASTINYISGSGYYILDSASAIIDNANTSKGILATIKNIFSSITSLPSKIASSLGSFFTDLGNKIVNLGTTIINGIKDTLISLFIPDDDYFSNWLNDFKTIVEEKLGFLIYPFELFADVINRFLNLNDGDGIIDIPEVKVPNFDFTIIEAQTYNLKDLYETNHIKTIHTIYLYIIDILLVIGIVNLAKNKYNSTFGGA